MVDAIIRSTIGNWGSTLLDFYRDYSLIINSVIFLYAMVVVFSRRTYYGMLDNLVPRLTKKYGREFKGKNSDQIHKILDRMKIDKDQLLDLNRFPFISSPGGLIPYPKTIDRVDSMLNNEVLAGEIYRRKMKMELDKNAKRKDNS